jgi:GNAT superfamily N-acetyltransferase
VSPRHNFSSFPTPHLLLLFLPCPGLPPALPNHPHTATLYLLCVGGSGAAPAEVAGQDRATRPKPLARPVARNEASNDGLPKRISSDSFPRDSPAFAIMESRRCKSRGTRSPVAVRLVFLLDSNVLIPAEPFSTSVDASVARLLSRIHELGHVAVVHPANFDDLARARNADERAQKLSALGKYPTLAEVPIPAELERAAGVSSPGSNDHRDLRLLAALQSGAATYLVTEDRGLKTRAARANLDQSIATVHEALELLDRLHPLDASPPPHVRLMPSYLIDESQPIFDSLRIDYPAFDRWLFKVKRDAMNRRCWVVIDDDGHYDAIAIVKIDDEIAIEHPVPATKIATFKVDDRRAGDKVGELLLRAVLTWAASQPSIERLFVEIKPDKDGLIWFLEQFGFSRVSSARNNGNDHTYAKALRPAAAATTSAFAFHRAFGPPAVAVSAPVYVVPIEPKWFVGLFPDAPSTDVFGGQLLGETAPATPFGNAIRKAYLCRSPTHALPQGATLLFYRSGGGPDGSAVQAVGVAEGSIRTPIAERVLSYVGRRTVYSEEDVGAMCDAGTHAVLATLFRHDHFVTAPWTLRELLRESVLHGPPQSITHVQDPRGLEWLRSRLNESQ